MLKAREAPSAELERLRLMIPKSRSTTRKKNGKKSRAKEHQEFFVADSTGRGNGVVVREV
jgi:hypothetical protein